MRQFGKRSGEHLRSVFRLISGCSSVCFGIYKKYSLYTSCILPWWSIQFMPVVGQMGHMPHAIEAEPVKPRHNAVTPQQNWKNQSDLPSNRQQIVWPNQLDTKHIRRMLIQQWYTMTTMITIYMARGTSKNTTYITHLNITKNCRSSRSRNLHHPKKTEIVTPEIPGFA